VKEDQALEAESANAETGGPTAAGGTGSPSAVALVGEAGDRDTAGLLGEERGPAAAGVGRVSAVGLASQLGNRAFSALALSRVAPPGLVQQGDMARLAAIGGPLARARPGGAALARYQQGEAGHGGIEAEGLGKAGFTPKDVKSTYFGNWLRDFSQIGESGARPPALMLLLNILSLGEFERELTDADLGTYVPSEHLDNPEGGGTVEDPKAAPTPGATGGVNEEALAKLSPQQRAAYERQRAAGLEILAASAKSGLPPYIEQGKMHAREMLAEAVSKGETPEGMQALGNGLHVVEDYFSHSNFTEVCIVTLKDDPAVKPLVDRLLETTLGHDLSALVPPQAGGGESGAGAPEGGAPGGGAPSGGAPAQSAPSGSESAGSEPAGSEAREGAPGRMQIQTGTYGPGPNQTVSMIEALETELTNGELRRTFIKGSVRVNNFTVEQAVEQLSGAGFGAKLATYALKEVVDVVDVACDLFGEEAVEKVFGFVVPPLESLLGPLTSTLTSASGQQAKQEGLSGPTHSELAKDSPDNPLYAVSRALAVEADKQIGEQIKQVWATMPKPTESKESGSEPAPAAPPAEQAPAQSEQPTGGPGGKGTPQQEAVTSLVDKFISNPADDPWWEPVIKEAAGGGGAQ
jgi:hypothetical protein